MSTEIKPEINELASKLTTHLTLGDNGVITTAKEALEATLPEDLTMGDVDKVYKHLGTLAPAYVKAIGDMSEAAMAKDAKLVETNGKMDIGRWADIQAIYKRSEERRKSPSDATMVTVQGATSVKINTKVRTGADMKRVRAALIESAKAKFGK